MREQGLVIRMKDNDNNSKDVFWVVPTTFKEELNDAS